MTHHNLGVALLLSLQSRVGVLDEAAGGGREVPLGR